MLVRCMSTSQLGHVDRSGHGNEERHVNDDHDDYDGNDGNGDDHDDVHGACE